MKRSILVLLLLSTSAWAEWTPVGGNDELKVYVDRATVVENGNTVRMWALFDYATAQQWSDYLTYWSRKVQTEFDCTGAQQHTLTSSLHRERMGGGDSVYTVPGGISWQPVNPGSIDEVLWKFACKQ